MSAALMSSRCPQGCRNLRVSTRSARVSSSSARRLVIVRADPKTNVTDTPGKTTGPAKAVEATDATWEVEVLAASKSRPVVVDFWAPWCGPCRMISGVVDELADYYVDKVKFVKLNTDAAPGTAQAYNIRSIPTLMVFQNGEKMESIIGAVPRSTLQASIDKFVTVK